MISGKLKMIRSFVIRNHNKILTLLMAFAGLLPVIACEYGSPSATYVLKGNVKSSSSNQPIQNIMVKHYGTGALTNVQGDFSLTFTSDGDGKIIKYSFLDIDTASNGSFKDKDTVISFENVVFTEGKDKWDEGTGEQNVEIKLDPK
jgi:putative lipoprotein (rSAM/lipoprotein system)